MAGSLSPSSRRRFSSACGVADWPRMEAATSPGRISVPAKIRTETAKSNRMPSAMRWAMSFRICIGPSALLQPDAGRRPQVRGFVVRVADPALDLLPTGVDAVVEHRPDEAAVIAHLERRLAIELGAPLLVELGAGLKDDLVEAFVEEAGVVPVRAGDVGGGVHRILRRSSAPVGGAEGLLVPNLGPVTVARLALDLQFDAGFGGLLLEQLRRVDRAGEGDVRGAQQDRAAVAGLLVVELGLLRIVDALLNIGWEQGVGLVDREVVSDRCIAHQDLVDHLLAVDRELQGHAQGVVVERRRVAMHDEN